DIVNIREFPVGSNGGTLKLRVVMDRYSLELFVNDGEQAASFVIYTPVTADSISFYADGAAIIDVEKYDIEV
ncbi:MAG: GH32 C-terminal domain-containing protein, partial [Clostridia bacterium]|nr:GH32 C-terminal domain-containing protein [Clostridia bacterium]